MINSNFLKVPDELKKEFNDAFRIPKEKNCFRFLRKFLRFLEDDNKAYNCTMMLSNPLNDHENENFNRKMHLMVYEFLYRVLQSQYEGANEKKYKGDAHNYLGVGYEFGVFTLDFNAAKAFENYTISAQLGSRLGTFRLAQTYEKALGTKASPDVALSFYRCSAKLGLVDGLHAYGIILLNGFVGSTKDPQTGIYYLKNAARKADGFCPYPLYDLGIYYETGEQIELASDLKYSLKLYKKAAKLGDSNSQFKLGSVYEFGDLYETRNMKKSVDYYKMAAENGHVEAQHMMSEYFLVGKGNCVEKSYEKSNYWAKRAAIKRHPDAAMICGDCSVTGTGTEKDILEALWWYKISESFGHTNVKEKIKNLEQQISRQNKGPENYTGCCSCFFG